LRNKQSSPELGAPELLRVMQRYHRLRASQRAVEPGQNALSTLLTEQAQRLCDLPNASTAG